MLSALKHILWLNITFVIYYYFFFIKALQTSYEKYNTSVSLKGSIWVEREAEAWMPHCPDHTLRSPCQHQQLILPAHLYHLPPCSKEPAPHFAGCHWCLRHYSWQGGDTPSHLLQGGQKPQQQHGELQNYPHTLSMSVQILQVLINLWWFLFLHIIVGILNLPLL